MYMYMCIYIYIYTYIHTYIDTCRGQGSRVHANTLCGAEMPTVP